MNITNPMLNFKTSGFQLMITRYNINVSVDDYKATCEDIIKFCTYIHVLENVNIGVI